MNKFHRDLKKEEYFYIVNDGYISSIMEMPRMLESISDEQYEFHAKNNDFGKWLEFIGLKELGERIKGKSKEKAISIIKDFISGIKKEEEKPEQEKIVEKNKFEEMIDRIDEKFSDHIEKLFPTLDEAMPEDVKKEIEEMNDKIDEFESRISEYRKRGYTFFIAPMLLRIAKQKILMAKASWKKEDIEKAWKSINELFTTLKSEVEEQEKIKMEEDKFKELFNKV